MAKWLAALVAVVVPVLSALTGAGAAKADDVVETARQSGTFETLLAALEAAQLAEVLAEQRNITLFAPTDAAFARYPDATVAALMRPENRRALQAILLHHVITGRHHAAEVAARADSGDRPDVPAVATRAPARLPAGTHVLDTLHPDDTLVIEAAEGDVRVGAARVVEPDILASNGVIHAIDAVLIPDGLAIEIPAPAPLPAGAPEAGTAG